MLADILPFKKVWASLRKDSALNKAILSFVQFMEQRLGARFVYERAALPLDDPELLDLSELAEKMRRAGIIVAIGSGPRLPDEPPLKAWGATFVSNRLEGTNMSGGMSRTNDRSALTSALAEALERHLWIEADDYFVSPLDATSAEIKTRGVYLAPERFAGYTPTQRAHYKRLTLSPDAKYRWVEGHSWVNRGKVHVPAQIVSGMYGNAVVKEGLEPIILAPITTGLATGPSREFAVLNGALEIIERDAFMITWLNQLTPPRIDMAKLAARSPEIERLCKICSRYRLHFEVALLPTDVPAYAVCAVVRDESSVGPATTIGLRAHRNLADAAEGALLEALRVRNNVRNRRAQGKKTEVKDASQVVHTERLAYWDAGNKYHKLDFLTKGKVLYPREAWENDSLEQHLERLVSWCREKGYEFASVALTRSVRNVSPWHVEFVIIPELIPLHQDERMRYAGGLRRESVPKLFGYAPREKPYFEEPHPFA
jgi:ribosomal protein S12 methylthiotransferase accessory factor